MKIGYLGKLMAELFDFAKKEKIYWIMPLLLILILIGILIVTSQAAAPFIYTLF